MELDERLARAIEPGLRYEDGAPGTSRPTLASPDARPNGVRVLTDSTGYLPLLLINGRDHDVFDGQGPLDHAEFPEAIDLGLQTNRIDPSQLVAH